MRISDWSSDVCSSDLHVAAQVGAGVAVLRQAKQHVGRLVAGAVARHDAITGAAQDRRQEILAPAVRVVGQPAERLARPGGNGADRKRVGSGKRVSVLVNLGGRRYL